MESKKSKYIQICIVLAIVVAIIGVSYAMFSFSASGTKSNVIRSGNVEIDFKNVSTITLNNVYPLSDSTGAAGTDPNSAKMNFDVVSTLSGAMTIYYDLSLTAINEGTTLKSDKVKINLKKTSGSTTSWPLGSASTGVTIDSLKTTAGRYASLGNGGGGTRVTSYAIDSGAVTTTSTVNYTLTAWISDTYKYNSSKTTAKACSNPAYTTEATCKDAGAVWGDKQTSSTSDETYSFKVKLDAVQGV